MEPIEDTRCEGVEDFEGPDRLLTDLFDHVFVINCQHRPDRLQDFREEIVSRNLADFDKITVVRAIIGDYTTHPVGFNAGRGAWGCLQSYRRTLEDLMHMRDERGDMNWDSALFLEDDVTFRQHTDVLASINKFMRAVPGQWGQLYLGGQHRQKPKRTESPLVTVGTSVNRTHAFAVSRSHIQKLYCHISYMPDYVGTNNHVDHQLERAHQRGDWPVYCMNPWACGQREGASNISGRINRTEFWD